MIFPLVGVPNNRSGNLELIQAENFIFDNSQDAANAESTLPNYVRVLIRDENNITVSPVPGHPNVTFMTGNNPRIVTYIFIKNFGTHVGILEANDKQPDPEAEKKYLQMSKF